VSNREGGINEVALITIKEYAARHGRDHRTALQKAQRGKFETAKKLGRDWVIDEDEPYVDCRIKSGKYQNWRKPKESQ